MHILKMSPAYRFIRVICAMALKDIKSILTERAFMLTSIIIPINFLLLFLLFAPTGGQAPTAVVLKDNGPYARTITLGLWSTLILLLSDKLRTSDAQNLMQKGQIVAIVTVPANFDATLKRGGRVKLPVVVNNLDVDFTNDIRRDCATGHYLILCGCLPRSGRLFELVKSIYTHKTPAMFSISSSGSSSSALCSVDYFKQAQTQPENMRKGQ